MKKIYLVVLLCLSTLAYKATSYTIAISGFAYSPSTLTVSIGDQITIQASGVHPLIELDQATWNANGTATLSTGFGEKTSNYTFTITSTNTIYYGCKNHIGMGMKGSIDVTAAGINENVMLFSNVNLFPNPAKNKVNLNFSVANDSYLNVKLFDVTGREITKLITNTMYNKGEHSLSFDVPNYLNAGNYFIEMSSGNAKTTKKLLITQ